MFRDYQAGLNYIFALGCLGENSWMPGGCNSQMPGWCAGCLGENSWMPGDSWLNSRLFRRVNAGFLEEKFPDAWQNKC